MALPEQACCRGYCTTQHQPGTGAVSVCGNCACPLCPHAQAERSQGGLPPAEQLERWLEHQPGLADDPRFRDAFRPQLIGLGQQLEQIAGAAGCTPLALSLEQLILWARSQADERLGQQQQAHPGQHQ